MFFSENTLYKGKLRLSFVDTSLKLFVNGSPIASIDSRLAPVFQRCVFNFDDLFINAVPLGTFTHFTITVDGLDIPAFSLAAKSISGENIGREN